MCHKELELIFTHNQYKIQAAALMKEILAVPSITKAILVK